MPYGTFAGTLRITSRVQNSACLRTKCGVDCSGASGAFEQSGISAMEYMSFSPIILHLCSTSVRQHLRTKVLIDVGILTVWTRTKNADGSMHSYSIVDGSFSHLLLKFI